MRVSLLPKIKIKPTEKVYLISAIIGLLTGLIAVLVSVALAHAENFLLHNLAGVRMDYASHEHHVAYKVKVIAEKISQPWMIAFIPGVGALLGALLAHRWGKDAMGSGTEAVIDAFHNKEGRMKPLTPFVKSVATVLTLGSGGAAGKEGPMTQVGAGFGSMFAWFFKMGTRARRTFLLAGAAGGLGAIFKAPLGGALTAIEVLYKEDIETDSLVPCIIASTVGYITYASFFGYERLFEVPYAPFKGFRYWSDALFYLVLGFSCVLFGKAYVSCFQFFKTRVFGRMRRVPIYIKPLIGGLLVGGVGFWFKDSIGSGLGTLQNIFLQDQGRLGDPNTTTYLAMLKTFALLAVLRTLNTSFTIGSGGSGGIFVPSLVVGGLIGAAFGCLYKILFPLTDTSIASYTIVGMGSFFAGVANAPIASMFMVIEITGAYQLLPPLMLVSMISIIFSKKYSIYTNQVRNRFSSPAHLWNMQIDVLKKLRLGELVERDLLDRRLQSNVVLDTTPLPALKKVTEQTHMTHFVVVDAEKNYKGNASLRSVNLQLDRALIAEDLIDHVGKTMQLKDFVPEALEHMATHNLSLVAVCDGKKVISVLDHKSITRYYQRAMRRYAKGQPQSVSVKEGGA